LGYVTPDQKVVAIAREMDGPYVMPSVESVNSQDYPIARDLYMYTAGEPAGLIAAYLDWIMDDEAQAIVAKLGFVPLRVRRDA
jgi:phosphate transport system substrate-binding protein